MSVFEIYFDNNKQGKANVVTPPKSPSAQECCCRGSWLCRWQDSLLWWSQYPGYTSHPSEDLPLTPGPGLWVAGGTIDTSAGENIHWVWKAILFLVIIAVFGSYPYWIGWCGVKRVIFLFILYYFFLEMYAKTDLNISSRTLNSFCHWIGSSVELVQGF